MKHFALFALLIGFTPSAFAAEYNVIPGDTLSGISQKLKFSVEDLAEMNGIKDPKLLQVGDVIVYYLPDDLEDASNWCLLRMKEVGNSSSSVYKQYMGGYENLLDSTISNRDTKSSISVFRLLDYAEAWRKDVAMRRLRNIINDYMKEEVQKISKDLGTH